MSNVPTNATDGNVEVPPQVTKVVNAIFSNRGKSLEKFALYVEGVLTATGVIPTASTTLKEWIIGATALVLHGLHISTKK